MGSYLRHEVTRMDKVILWCTDMDKLPYQMELRLKNTPLLLKLDQQILAFKRMKKLNKIKTVASSSFTFPECLFYLFALPNASNPCTGLLQTQKVPGGWCSQIWRQSEYEGGKVVSPTLRPHLLPGTNHSNHFLSLLDRASSW